MSTAALYQAKALADYIMIRRRGRHEGSQGTLTVNKQVDSFLQSYMQEHARPQDWHIVLPLWKIYDQEVLC